MGGNCSEIILRGHCILQSGPIGGPDEVVCASGAVLHIAPDVKVPSKIALCTAFLLLANPLEIWAKEEAFGLRIAFQRGGDPDRGRTSHTMHLANRF